MVPNLDKCKYFALCETDADCHGGLCYGTNPSQWKFCKCDMKPTPTTPASLAPWNATTSTSTYKTTTQQIWYDVCIPDKKCGDWPGGCGEAIGAGRCDADVRNFKKYKF